MSPLSRLRLGDNGGVATAIAWFAGLTLVLGATAAGVVCALKGKWFMGLLALPLAMTGVPFVGAARLARPDSWWARRRYDAAQSQRALDRWTPRSRSRVIGEIAAGVALLLVAFAFSTVVP